VKNLSKEEGDRLFNQVAGMLEISTDELMGYFTMPLKHIKIISIKNICLVLGQNNVPVKIR
jgi:hypothetical protein